MRRLIIGDKRMRVRDEGEDSEGARARTPVVMVHGAAASSVVWIDAVKRIAPRRRAVALDLPGHAQSDAWHDSSVDIYRDAVGTVCAKLALKKVVLMGHSLGAAVALRCAAAWPERVAALVLVGAAAEMSVPPEVYTVLHDHFADAGKLLAPMLFSPATPVERVDRWTAVLPACERDIALADYRAVDGWKLGDTAGLASLPTLIVSGADDLLTPPRRAQELAARLSNARTVVLQHTAHMCFLEQPDAFFTALDSFLGEVP